MHSDEYCCMNVELSIRYLSFVPVPFGSVECITFFIYGRLGDIVEKAHFRREYVPQSLIFSRTYFGRKRENAVSTNEQLQQEAQPVPLDVPDEDFFLSEFRDEFLDNARYLINEAYCRIHQKMNIGCVSNILSVSLSESHLTGGVVRFCD